jgi:hypothetical protein
MGAILVVVAFGFALRPLKPFLLAGMARMRLATSSPSTSPGPC